MLLLNSRLELERVLLDTQQHQLVKKPWRLCYIEQTRQLIVNSFSSKTIQIYALKQVSH